MNPAQELPGLDLPAEPVDFTPTRAAGLARLDRFVSRAGAAYARGRNHDLGPERRSNVSALSPWLRHRLLTEEEVLRATLARHSLSASEKFVQEVFWRTYFKGWLEQRPAVWQAYRQGVDRALEDLQRDRRLAADFAAATEGRTGIDCFDAWARELVETGYLHNHARMWFASIWIFTLRLPWQLGADFFLRHLMDGDPASNTLSWRWVGGLHTRGKTYQARASNIRTYTGGRFSPEGQLAGSAPPLEEDEQAHPRRPLLPAGSVPRGDYLLLVTEEEGRPLDLLPHPPVACLGVLATEVRSPLPLGGKARDFAQGALAEALAGTDGDPAAGTDPARLVPDLIAQAEAAGTRDVVTAHVPTGPLGDILAKAAADLEAAGLTLHQPRRPYDDAAWPHATKGFFAVKKQIPGILRTLGLQG